MKKKIVMVIAVLGMAFATVQVNAQNERLMVSGPTKTADAVHTGGRFITCACCNPDGACSVVACE